MHKGWIAAQGLILAALGFCGCSVTGIESHASLSTPEPASIGAPASDMPAQVSMGPFLEGPIGSRLAVADRDSAFKAETLALSTGDRKTWRGLKGTYGFVVPDAAAGTACRGFTHTIYFGGRPQVGHGTGCRDPDGSWRITG